MVYVTNVLQFNCNPRNRFIFKTVFYVKFRLCKTLRKSSWSFWIFYFSLVMSISVLFWHNSPPLGTAVCQWSAIQMVTLCVLGGLPLNFSVLPFSFIDLFYVWSTVIRKSTSSFILCCAYGCFILFHTFPLSSPNSWNRWFLICLLIPTALKCLPKRIMCYLWIYTKKQLCKHGIWSRSRPLGVQSWRQTGGRGSFTSASWPGLHPWGQTKYVV